MLSVLRPTSCRSSPRLRYRPVLQGPANSSQVIMSQSNRRSSPGPGTGGIERLKAFPRAPAPNDDPTSVKSNLEPGDVELLQNILAYHVAHHPDSKVFGNAQAAGLKLVEAFVRSPGSGQTNDLGTTKGGSDFRGQRPDKLEAVTVCELTVEEGE